VKGLFLFLVLACLSQAAMAESIVIDPGHGGTDSGGTGNSMEEADVVLDTSKRFRDLLEADSADASGGGSWTVSMTRTTDVFVSLAGRSAYANSIGADRFMSIHANAFGNTTANGTETFSYGESGQSASLRNLVQEEMIDEWQLTNRGNKTANFSVLRNTAMPAELHELGFITHSGDAAKLASTDARQAAAEAHLRALQRHYGLDPYIPGATTTDAGVGSLLVQTFASDVAAEAAIVTLDGEEVGSTDAEGVLRLEEVDAGAHLIGVWKEGYVAIDKEIELAADDELEVIFDLELVLGTGDDNVDEGGGPKCDAPMGGSCSKPPQVAGGCNSSGHGAPLPLAFLLLLGVLRMRQATRN
jgi:N-acetylmuramoyl-L-alanine amidase